MYSWDLLLWTDVRSCGHGPQLVLGDSELLQVRNLFDHPGDPADETQTLPTKLGIGMHDEDVVEEMRQRRPEPDEMLEGRLELVRSHRPGHGFLGRQDLPRQGFERRSFLGIRLDRLRALGRCRGALRLLEDVPAALVDLDERPELGLLAQTLESGDLLREPRDSPG